MKEASDLKQRTKSNATRLKILEAARFELVNKGYAGFRISAVAELAGVSKGALTHHFDSKNTLVTQVIDFIYKNDTERSNRLISKVNLTSDLFDCLIEDLKSFYLGENFKISISLLSLEEVEPELHDVIKSVTRQYRIPVEEKWIEKIMEFSLTEEEAMKLLSMSQAMLRGIPLRLHLLNDKGYINQILEEWKRVALLIYPALNKKSE
ncbi:TetR/AcrR family transcriptional regulator [Acinetobacter johnsonii]|uniref:TetR/AcrR family transcriptional regulator n=1 Tax=Acinetobacter johnsonii TaxID=40214 RepID=UPI0024477246|nr:TetR/AcrR family transcriptional regulator [Acinetobacter johnsonii]MDH1699650.1 TetR/AcrR family transcriptional regulator [Acinetobacter johnsonii]